MSAVLAVVCCLLLVLYIARFYRNVRRYPKGPTPLPFIGNYHQLSIDNIHLFYEQCHDKYGDVFTVFLPTPTVVLMEFENIKEALLTKGDAFLGRLGTFPEDVTMVIPNGGITFAEGESWKRQRRTAMTILRQFGVGSGIIEHQVRDSCDRFMSHLTTLPLHEGIEFRWPFQILVANVINNLLFGYQYEFNNSSRLMKIADLLTHLVEDARSNPLVLLSMKFRWIPHVPWLGYKAEGKYRDIAAEMHSHVRDDISLCLESYSSQDEPSCFVHAYHRAALKDPALTSDQLVNVCLDLFLAGMETTATTLRWAVLFLAEHPEVQDRMRSELHAYTGGSRTVSFSDRRQLPYTMATLTEIQRRANIVPQNIAKRALDDVEIAGKMIPRGSLVATQLYSVHRKEFVDSESFNPSRFLNDDGTLNKEIVERVNPFGMGKRQCAGEWLARAELFVCLTTLIAHYTIHPADETTPLNKEPIPAIILLPPTNLIKLLPVNSCGEKMSSSRSYASSG